MVADTLSPEANPHTNGTLVVYESTRGGERHTYWRSLGGGVVAFMQDPFAVQHC